MRAVPGGFDLTYTQPVSEATAAELASRYEAEQWRYTPTGDYGGPKIAEEELAVRSATLSDDGRTVRLRLDGLKPDRVVHVRSPRPFTSASGETLWSTEAWYTLNEMPGKQPPAATLYEAEEARLTGKAGINTDHIGYSGSGFVDRYATEGDVTTTFDVTVPRPAPTTWACATPTARTPSRAPSRCPCTRAGRRCARHSSRPPGTGTPGPPAPRACGCGPATTRSPTATTPATPVTSTST